MADPDWIEVMAPTACAGCGGDLHGVSGLVASSVQVFDTPPVRLQVAEYRMLKVSCPACRAVTKAPAPAGVRGPCCYGPNVRAKTALLACHGHVSIERAADLMEVLPGAPVSTGFAGGLVRRVAGRFTMSSAGARGRCIAIWLLIPLLKRVLAPPVGHRAVTMFCGLTNIHQHESVYRNIALQKVSRFIARASFEHVCSLTCRVG